MGLCRIFKIEGLADIRLQRPGSKRAEQGCEPAQIGRVIEFLITHHD